MVTMSEVLREVAECADTWRMRVKLCARADELDAQKMPGTLDIPGVKDYVNATPPVPDSSTTSDAREQSVSGGSWPVAGLDDALEWFRYHHAGMEIAWSGAANRYARTIIEQLERDVRAANGRGEHSA